jgi:hypothetical protein
MTYIVIGNIGSDAGYWVLDGSGLHHVGGWGVDQMLEVSAALNIMRTAPQLKTPGLAEAVARTVSDFVDTQLKGLVPDGGVVIITGP